MSTMPRTAGTSCASIPSMPWRSVTSAIPQPWQPPPMRSITTASTMARDHRVHLLVEYLGDLLVQRVVGDHRAGTGGGFGGGGDRGDASRQRGSDSVPDRPTDRLPHPPPEPARWS